MAVAAVSTLMAVQAHAQGADSDAADNGEAIDEIKVIGSRPLATIRAEITLAEDQVFTLFNELNDDDGYDIVCRKRARIGSRIPKRVCLARMYREYIEDETVDYGGQFPIGKMPGAARHEKIFLEKLERLANENPEFLRALAKRYSLIKEYESERERRRGE